MIEINDFTLKSIEVNLPSDFKVYHFGYSVLEDNLQERHYYVDLLYKGTKIHTTVKIPIDHEFNLSDIVKEANLQIEDFLHFFRSSSFLEFFKPRDKSEFLNFIKNSLFNRFGYFYIMFEVHRIIEVDNIDELLTSYVSSLPEYNKRRPDFFVLYSQYVDKFKDDFANPILDDFVENYNW